MVKLETKTDRAFESFIKKKAITCKMLDYGL